MSKTRFGFSFGHWFDGAKDSYDVDDTKYIYDKNGGAGKTTITAYY